MVSIGLQNFTTLGTVVLPACKTQLIFLPEILRLFFSLSCIQNPGSQPTTGFPSVKNWDVPKIGYSNTSRYTAILSNLDPIIPSKWGDPGTGAQSPRTAQEPPQRCNFRMKDLRRWFWEPCTCTAGGGARSCPGVVAHSGLRCNNVFSLVFSQNSGQLYWSWPTTSSETML